MDLFQYENVLFVAEGRSLAEDYVGTLLKQVPFLMEMGKESVNNYIISA